MIILTFPILLPFPIILLSSKVNIAALLSSSSDFVGCGETEDVYQNSNEGVPNHQFVARYQAAAHSESGRRSVGRHACCSCKWSTCAHLPLTQNHCISAPPLARQSRKVEDHCSNGPAMKFPSYLLVPLVWNHSRITNQVRQLNVTHQTLEEPTSFLLLPTWHPSSGRTSLITISVVLPLYIRIETQATPTLDKSLYTR